MKRIKVFLIVSFMISALLVTMLFDVIVKAYNDNSYLPLDGVVVVLDAGHGGKDAGASSGSVNEKDINLQVTNKLRRALKDKGAKVILTRQDDNDLSSKIATNHKKEDMKKRIEIVNSEDVDCFLSIHLNKYSSSNVKGGIVFYERNNEVSKVFANKIQTKLNKLNSLNKQTKTGDYYLLKNASKVGALIECGFLSNEGDKQKLVSEKYQNRMVKYIADGVGEYFEFIQ